MKAENIAFVIKLEPVVVVEQSYQPLSQTEDGGLQKELKQLFWMESIICHSKQQTGSLSCF